MFRAILLLSVLIAVPAEAQSWRPTPAEIAAADYGPAPQNHEKIVKAWLAENLKDPASAMVREISKPERAHFVENAEARKVLYGYKVCATVNAKNGLGGYVGWKARYFLIRDGEVLTTVGETGRYRLADCQR